MIQGGKTVLLFSREDHLLSCQNVTIPEVYIFRQSFSSHMKGFAEVSRPGICDYLIQRICEQGSRHVYGLPGILPGVLLPNHD